MTEGNILKQIAVFSIPLLLGNLFQQAYNVVDASIVGKTLGANALASVGVSSSVQFLVLGFCMGAAIGFSVPVATQFGAGNLHKMRQYVYISAILTAVIAAGLTVITIALCPSILHLLAAPAEIYEDAYQYLVTIFAGISFTFLYNYLSGILRAIGDSRTPFLFLAFSAVLNVFLDLFCICVLHLGCFGAAIATIIAQGISGILCLLLIIRKFNILHLEKEDRVFDMKMAGYSLNMGVPMGLQYSITAIGSMVMQMSNNSLGTLYVSAYAAGLKIKQFMLSPFNALSAAAATFCSQNYGALKSERIKKGIQYGICMTLGYSIIAAAVLTFFGRTLSLLFLDESTPEILDASARYLRYIGVFYPALGILDMTRQIIQGLGWSQRAVLSGVIEMIARIAVCASFTSTYGFTAICCADQAAWVTADVYCILTLIACVKHAENSIRLTAAHQLSGS
ncbi:MAG: MATE family efflux transporter [Erysipelotrichia bacterium]|nr:MATE family efflux transporter [Erysipelotrichia bacterium]